jgi:hypothetical protein
MSLFRLCELWHRPCPGEEIDSRHLDVLSGCLLAGNYAGRLRVMRPGEDADLLFEKDLGEPLLHLAVKDGRVWLLTLRALRVCDLESGALRLGPAQPLKEPAFQMSLGGGLTVVQHLSTRLTLFEDGRAAGELEVGHMLFPQPPPLVADGRVWLTLASYNLVCYRISSLLVRASFLAPEYEIELGEDPLYYRLLDRSLWILTHS